jgi:hypothetical protein
LYFKPITYIVYPCLTQNRCFLVDSSRIRPYSSSRSPHAAQIPQREHQPAKQAMTWAAQALEGALEAAGSAQAEWPQEAAEALVEWAAKEQAVPPRVPRASYA